jgi:hypothetical protein
LPDISDVGHRSAISRLKVQPSSGVAGHFTKDDFAIDLDAGTVTLATKSSTPLSGASDNSGSSSPF